MRITLILNPDAGNGGTSADELRRTIEGAGHEVETRAATKGHLSEVLDRPGELIVVAGGDGTVGRIMRVLAGSPVPMTILPTGTANNIARSLGIRGETAALAASWARLDVRRVDVGTVRGPWGETRFVESAGIGLLGELIHPEVSGDIDGTGEGRDAVRRLARTLTARPTRVEIDGEDHTASYLLLEAMNIRCVGPESLARGPRQGRRREARDRPGARERPAFTRRAGGRVRNLPRVALDRAGEAASDLVHRGRSARGRPARERAGAVGGRGRGRDRRSTGAAVNILM